MGDSAKRKISDTESPLQSKTVSKMKFMDPSDITKFELEVAQGENTELKEGIKKLTESGLEYLTNLCKLHNVNMKGETISEIITDMLIESVVNDHSYKTRKGY